jgi:predicted amidohydrolase
MGHFQRARRCAYNTSMTPERVRIAMAQMLVEGGRPEANLRRATARIAQAAEAGCGVVVLPETLDCGWTHPSARLLAQPFPGPHTEPLARAARQHGIWVVAGLVERAGDALYNASVLIDPQGLLRLAHRKLNELDIAAGLYSRGDSLRVAPTPFGRVAIPICADLFPETAYFAATLAHMGCGLILSPCAWAVEASHDNRRDPYGELWRGSYGAIARHHGITVVGVSNVGLIEEGAWAGRRAIGCSLAIGAAGELAEGPYGEEALLVVETGAR